MSDDVLRAAGMAAGGVFYWVLIQKASAYLSRRKQETGRGLAERLGHRIGKAWANCRGST